MDLTKAIPDEEFEAPEFRFVHTSTPWGPASAAYTFTRGVILYSALSHGGFKVSPTKLAEMPPALRVKGGWYEEDCEWAKVALAFPEIFPRSSVESALATAREYFPEVLA